MAAASFNELYENNDNNPISNGKKKENDEEFDLQTELEAKFDKLFGKSNKKNNDD